MIDISKYEYNCPQEGCGRETTHVEEDYFECRCGWFGQRISNIEDLEKDLSSWKIWSGKYQDEIRYLRGLVDEIIIICGEYEGRELYNENSTIIDWDKTTLRKEILKAIAETQNEYEGAKEDE
jgi:hypothetical protein